MKLLKGILTVAIVAMIAVSCNETKKGVEKDASEAIEVVEDATNDAVDATKEAVDETVEAVGEVVDSVKTEVKEVVENN